MGYKKLQLKLNTNYSEKELRRVIQKKTHLNGFTFQIAKKSLDARNKRSPFWLVSLVIHSKEIKGEEYREQELLEIPYKKRDRKVVVVGSGPAGFFAAHVLQLAGFEVTIIERGSKVDIRETAIKELETKGKFNPKNNYAFGEGGAGTFSDGKLTSRSKHISAERRFILNEYVKAGAPEEILYLSHPHIGTDKLKLVVASLREQFLLNGGTFLFETQLEKIRLRGRKLINVICNTGDIDADLLILATGHSAYDTYRMLLDSGVNFRTKNFAIGHRIEHSQRFINMAQWGKEELAGVKAAEYRLTYKTQKGLPVYSFCMCPGGTVVPAAAFEERSVVNGMSYYQRDGNFSNAGCVVGVHPDVLFGQKSKPQQILDWIDKQEERYYNFSKSYVAPAGIASDYIQKTESKLLKKSSYQAGLLPAPLYDFLPEFVSEALIEGLVDFNRKIPGFDQGMLIGFESKTSSPLQVVRDENGKCEGFDNLYFVGEGGGYAGGIISSAADGVKCAMAIANS